MLARNSTCGVQGCTNMTNVGVLQKGLHLTTTSGLVRICRTCLLRLLGEVSDGTDTARDDRWASGRGGGGGERQA